MNSIPSLRCTSAENLGCCTELRSIVRDAEISKGVMLGDEIRRPVDYNQTQISSAGLQSPSIQTIPLLTVAQRTNQRTKMLICGPYSYAKASRRRQTWFRSILLVPHSQTRSAGLQVIHRNGSATTRDQTGRRTNRGR